MDFVIELLNTEAAKWAIAGLFVIIAIKIFGREKVKATLPVIDDYLGKFDELIKFAEKHMQNSEGAARKAYVVAEFISFFREIIGRQLTAIEMGQIDALVSERHTELEASGLLDASTDKAPESNG